MWIDRTLIAGPFIALCLSERQFKQALRHLGYSGSVNFLANDHAHATSHHFNDTKSNPATVICLGDMTGRSPIEIAGLLIHEAVHAWQNYCEYIGERSPSEEFEAYSIQTIAQQLLEQYAKAVR